ncbi:P-loop containing nucleoside triphosphate hydrolase protein [Tribonema minus]|uniref:P-loop containing nucleoside triphosphate hydrolase protein n=1 Tax=Tribonema minus TaxID=303371 RepID=A0A835Z2H3_9STRA|nr:P-loop containing nucleoside triphosphate hydrolase protein [Tribonema minus]
MSSLKRAADGAEDTGEDAGAAKRCKEQPRWLRVEELFFKWYAFVCGTVAAHWLNLSYDTFIAAGMLPLYSTARQGRIIISAEVPEDQRGFDGVVFDGDVPVLAQVKDHARPIGPGALGSTCCAILRMRQTNPEVRSLIASTSGFTEELVEMDASLLNAELLHIDYEQMKTALEPPPAPFQLRGIQVEAIAALQAWLTEALRVFVLGMPPGSGKTLAVAHFLLQLAEQLALFDVVIASPTRLLVQQTEAVLRGVLPDATFVTVSSDGTTSPEAIFAGKDDGRPLIISTTFDSAHVVAAAIRLREGRDVVVFVDEAHLYNQQLEELCNSASKMCLVSGTPTGIPLDLLAEEFVEYTVSMERAAAEGLIVSPRMFYPIGADLNDDSVAAKCEFIAVTSLREDNGMRRPLIFAKDKKEGTAFIAALAAEYVTHGIRAAGRVLTGDTTQSEREGLRAWFEGGEGGNEVRFITCVHVPNQGVDFPRCDGVFLTTIANHITALQRICRAVRTYPGKQFCSVLLWMSDANLMDLAQLGLGAAHVRCITATLEATDVAKERVATVKANDQLQVLVAARGNLSYREWSWWRRTETIERLGGCVAVKMGPKARYGLERAASSGAGRPQDFLVAKNGNH